MSETWDEIWLRKGAEDTIDLRKLNGYEQTTIDMSRVAAAIVSAMKIAPGSRLLEVGCGAGALAVELLRAAPGAHYVGTERSATLARKHISLLGHQVLNFSAHEAVFRDQFFDYGVCFSVFHYFESLEYAREAVGQLLRQCRDVFIGDLPAKSNDASHRLYGDQELAFMLADVPPERWRWKKSPGLYNPDRYNLVIARIG